MNIRPTGAQPSVRKKVSAPAQESDAEGWSTSLDRVMDQAIGRYNLRERGWRGFEQLPWVQDMNKKYPAMENIATTCSVHTPGYLDQVRDLFRKADAEDRPRLQNYFIGKLGLEELSCRQAGAAGGLCDKKGAFIQIWELTRSLVPDS